MTRVRFRVDGSLFEHTMLKNNIHELIVTRIKILAGLNIAEKRVPQDGGIADVYKRQILMKKRFIMMMSMI